MRAQKFIPALVTGAAILVAGCSAEPESDTSSGGQGGGGASGSSSGAGGSGGTSGSTGAMAASGGSGGTSGSGGTMGEPCEVGGKAGTCIDVADCNGDYVPTPGYCPGPANIQCCTKVTPGTCNENAKPQPNGGLSEQEGEGGCPSGMIPIETFCIDRYEASLVYADDGSPFSPYFNPGIANVRAVSIAEAVPQGYISGIEAEDACTMSGKRLCTNEEWKRACRGPMDTVYPYGDTLILGACNDHRSVHPAVEYFGTSEPWIYSELGNPCINQLPSSLDPAGTNPECRTFEGAFDMMGNLHEWTSDPAGTFRGGFYVDTKLNGPGCLYVTTAHPTSHWDYSTGFRCCADP